MLLIPALVSCHDSAAPDVTSGQTVQAGSTESAITESTDAFEFRIPASDLNKYKIIYAAGANDSVSGCAAALRAAVNEKTGATLECTDDGAAAGQYEILLGDTNRSAEYVSSDFDVLEYGVIVEGEKIYIIGGSDDALGCAVSKFTDMYISGDSIVINKKEEIFQLSLSDFGDTLTPVLSFDFDEYSGGRTSSSDGSVSAKLVNYDVEGGYKGNGVRFHGTTTKYGGAVLSKGTVYKAVSGSTSYTVSMWIHCQTAHSRICPCFHG